MDAAIAATGSAPCPVLSPPTVLTSRRSSSIRPERWSDGGPSDTSCGNGPNWSCSCTGSRPCPTPRPRPVCDSIPTRSGPGGGAGPGATSPWRMRRDGAARPLFPPLDEAVVKAIACEAVAQTGLPLSRQSLDDLTTRAHYALGKPISRSTVWRILDGDTIKPWRYEHWILPPRPALRGEGRGSHRPVRGPVGGPAAGAQGPHHQRRREDEHPGAGPLSPRHSPRPRAGPAGRVRVRPGRRVAVSRRLGRAAGLRHGPL